MLLKRLTDYYLYQQFFPGIISVIINPFFFFRLRLMQKMKKLAPLLEGKLLDFGCGCKPYQHLFTNTSAYIGVDMDNEGHDHQKEEIDVYYDGKTLPFEDESFDSVLSNEVLEHVPNLHEALHELNRVLKRNGKMLLSVPFVCFEHELPYDFRRLTVGGLSEALRECGFEVIISEKTGHYMEVISQLWLSYLRDLLYTNNRYINLVINALFLFPFTVTGLILSVLLPVRKGLYFDTMIVARKTGESHLPPVKTET